MYILLSEAGLRALRSFLSGNLRRKFHEYVLQASNTPHINREIPLLGSTKQTMFQTGVALQ